MEATVLTRVPGVEVRGRKWLWFVTEGGEDVVLDRKVHHDEVGRSGDGGTTCAFLRILVGVFIAYVDCPVDRSPDTALIGSCFVVVRDLGVVRCRFSVGAQGT